MTARVLAVRNKFESILKSSSSLTPPKLPDRFKGTILEKWANYWRQLLIDYKDVVIDVGKDIKARPIRATLYGTVAAGCYLCLKNNPDEDSFANQIRKCSSELIQVPETCRRPESAKHIRFLERCFNEGIVRRLSLGVVSFIWLDNYDEGVTLYKAMCPYLKPKYTTFHERIIDVGFWNRWWTLDEKMIDYDVNM